MLASLAFVTSLISSLFVAPEAAPCNLTYPLHNCTFHTISDCAATTSRFQIYSQYFGPDPPTADQNVTMWIEYAVPSSLTVAAGTSQDSVTLNGLPISSETSDLCKSVACPLTAGIHNTTNTFPWPAGLSVGSRVAYTTKWFDEQGALLLCSKVTVTTV
jgi:hypothetical protein